MTTSTTALRVGWGGGVRAAVGSDVLVLGAGADERLGVQEVRTLVRSAGLRSPGSALAAAVTSPNPVAMLFAAAAAADPIALEVVAELADRFLDALAPVLQGVDSVVLDGPLAVAADPLAEALTVLLVETYRSAPQVVVPVGPARAA